MPNGTDKAEGSKPEKKKKIAATPALKKIKVSSKLALVQDVILLMNEADISELSFEQSGVKIHLRRGAGMPFQTAMAPMMAPMQSMPMMAAPVAASPAGSASSGAAPAAKNDNTVTVNSPMVGTFYRSPAPDAKPFIEEGDKVEVGQVYCIIEAMKLMNEVKAEVAGKVVKIIAQNGQAVEFNQPLIVIDPS